MEIILHIGAHRTGSSAIEAVLAANQDALRAAGVELWRPAALRRMEAFRINRGQPVSEAARAALAEHLEQRGGSTALLTEENMIGRIEGNLERGHFYSYAAARLALYRDLLPVAPRRIGIGIRDYADFFVSSYAYVMAERPQPPFEELAPRLARVQRGWIDLVGDVRRVFPEAEILVWSMHTLSSRVRHVAARLAGVPAATLRPLRRTINPSIPRDAIPLARQILAAEPDIGRRALTARIAAAPAPEPGSFAGFTPDDAARLAERYAVDVALLKGGAHGVHFLSRAEASAA